MSKLQLPHTVPGIWPEVISPRRAVAEMRAGAPGDARVALLGVPDDMGVALNGGRPGAALGPTAIREALARSGAADALGASWPPLCDAGDVLPVEGDLLATHARVIEASAALRRAGLFPIGLGGGHDLTAPLLHGICLDLEEPPWVLYLDAHLDVRPELGSGMAFRTLVERTGIEELHVQGLDPLVNTDAHAAWFEAHGGHIDALEPEGPWPGGAFYLSVCLDVLDQSVAPGVSAPNPCGWSMAEALRWVRRAAREPGLLGFDVMELCPAHDEGGRTARLAARLVLELLAGLGEAAR